MLWLALAGGSSPRFAVPGVGCWPRSLRGFRRDGTAGSASLSVDVNGQLSGSSPVPLCARPRPLAGSGHACFVPGCSGFALRAVSKESSADHHSGGIMPCVGGSACQVEGLLPMLGAPSRGVSRIDRYDGDPAVVCHGAYIGC